MSSRARKIAWAIGGLIIGGGLMASWWDTHGAQVVLPDEPMIGAVALGLLGIPLSMIIQIIRTGWLLGVSPLDALRRLSRPLVLAHGLNVILPSMLGDLFEVWAVARATNKPVRGVLVVLLHRMATTIAALVILAALAIGLVWPSTAFVLLTTAIIGLLVIDLTMPRWSTLVRLPNETGVVPVRSLGLRWTGMHLFTALVQHGLEAVGIFFLGIGLLDPVAPSTAAGLVAIVDLVTYLPLPLAGMGANHWGASSLTTLLGHNPVILVTAGHAWQVLSGVLCCLIAVSVLPRGDEGALSTA